MFGSKDRTVMLEEIKVYAAVVLSLVRVSIETSVVLKVDRKRVWQN